MTEAIYRLSDVTQVRGGAEILALSSLDIAAGQVTAVLGPSGAGKTTLIRLLALLDAPTTGRVTCLDADPWAAQGSAGEAARVALRRRLALVSQRPLLFSGTAADNVGYGLHLRGYGRDEATRAELSERTDAALRACGVAQFARRNVRTLSGGEQQRVALARVLALRPEVLLLDEPTANLDPANIIAIETAVQAEVAARGISVVIVTHNPQQARRLAGQCLFLAGGKLVEQAATETFFTNPSTDAAKAFVSGAMIY